MGDIRNAGNLKFWTGYRELMEPARDKRFGPRIIKSFRQGRHYYLTQAVVLGINDFKCPQAHVEFAHQNAFESGFGLEIADCLDAVRSMV